METWAQPEHSATSPAPDPVGVVGVDVPAQDTGPARAWQTRTRTVGPPPADPPLVDLSEALVRARDGEEDAFRAIYRAVQPGLLRYLWGLVGDDAEDVAAEAWAQIARDFSSFRGDMDGFRGWAATIARHRALDHLRWRRRRPPVGPMTQEQAELAAVDDTAANAIERVSTDAALALIANLPRDQAEAVLLRVVMGLDATMAGKVLGKRAGAVRGAAHRGLRRLADQLDLARPGQTGARRRRA